MVRRINPIDHLQIGNQIMQKDLDDILHHILEPQSIRAAIINAKLMIAKAILGKSTQASLVPVPRPPTQRSPGTSTLGGHMDTSNV